MDDQHRMNPCGQSPQIPSPVIAKTLSENPPSELFGTRKSTQQMIRTQFATPISLECSRLVKHEVKKNRTLSFEEEWSRLPSVLNEICGNNPESAFEVNTIDNKFNACFVTMPFADTILQNSLPLLCVDATFFRWEFKQVLFLLTSVDALAHVHILCLGISNGETSQNWNAFFNFAKRTIPTLSTPMVIISDRGSALVPSINNSFPHHDHHFCLYHVANNLRTHLKDQNKEEIEIAVGKLWAAARAEDPISHSRIMVELFECNQTAYSFLDGLDKAKWTISHFRLPCFSRLTSQTVEITNARLLPYRDLHPVSFFIHLYVQLLESHIKYQSEIAFIQADVPEPVSLLVQKEMNKSITLNVMHLEGGAYQVYSMDRNDGCPVNIVGGVLTCQCQWFTSQHLPCQHTLAVCSKYGHLSTTNYPSYFRTIALQNIARSIPKAINMKLDSFEITSLLPPAIQIPQTQKKRILSNGEPVKTVEKKKRTQSSREESKEVQKKNRKDKNLRTQEKKDKSKNEEKMNVSSQIPQEKQE